MPEFLFISDLHLAPEQGAGVELFVDFLRHRARRARALYILGDLFDAWIGDDDHQPAYGRIRKALRDLSSSGTCCYLMHGNRDFLIGRAFARACGCALLQDPTLVDLAGVPTLLMHGDLLCSDDLPYQRLRRRIRNPIAKRLFLYKSLSERRLIAADYRRQSATAIATKTQEIMDVNQHTVARYMRRYRAQRLIHGHTHRPADHGFELDGKAVRRLVLAPWQPRVGEALVVSSRGTQREPIRASGPIPGPSR